MAVMPRGWPRVRVRWCSVPENESGVHALARISLDGSNTYLPFSLRGKV